MSNPELDRTRAVRDMIFDLAMKYDSFIATDPRAQNALHELASLAGEDYKWAVREVVDEAEYIYHGGFL